VLVAYLTKLFELHFLFLVIFFESIFKVHLAQKRDYRMLSFGIHKLLMLFLKVWLVFKWLTKLNFAYWLLIQAEI
jgi:hypothetical protein